MFSNSVENKHNFYLVWVCWSLFFIFIVYGSYIIFHTGVVFNRQDTSGKVLKVT